MKGVARRVIVVKSPESRLFEQAIFIVRESALGSEGVTADQVLREAQQTADGYMRRSGALAKRASWVAPVVYAAIGALVSSAAWALSLFL